MALAIAVWPAAVWAQPLPPPPSGGGLLGDAGGVRTALGQYGIQLGLQDISEVFGNPNGGRARGATFDGQVEASLGVDLAKAIGLQGGIFNVSSFGTYGHGISASHVDNLNLVSSVEAVRGAWLYELWYQQALPGGKVDVRIGQLGADQEFMITQYGQWFVNTAFGWPELPGADLPGGGPNVPLATPGIRVRAKPADPLTVLLGVFNGNPAGPGLGNPEKRARSGTRFLVGDGVFTIGEVQYALGGKDAGGRSVTFKAGGWYHHAGPGTTAVTSQDATGAQPVAVPGSAIARENYAGYAVVDAMLLPGPGGKGGLAAFARVQAAPASRSLVSFEIAGGLVYNGPFGRDKDQAGLGVTSVQVGRAVGNIGRLASQYVYHGHETVVELTYQAQMADWLQLQPDFQYVITPGGGIPDPDRPGHKVGSAAVFGLRANAAF